MAKASSSAWDRGVAGAALRSALSAWLLAAGAAITPPSSNEVYFTDFTGGTIQASNGSYIRTIRSALNRPSALQFDAASCHMYYSVITSTPASAIYRDRFDMAAQPTIVASASSEIPSMRLDAANNRLYYFVTTSPSECHRLDLVTQQSTYMVVSRLTATQVDIDVSVAPPRVYIMLADAIRYKDFNSSDTSEDPAVFFSDFDWIYEPTTLVVDSTNRYLYFGDSYDDRIVRVELGDATRVSEFALVHSPRGLSLDVASGSLFALSRGASERYLFEFALADGSQKVQQTITNSSSDPKSSAVLLLGTMGTCFVTSTSTLTMSTSTTATMTTSTRTTTTSTPTPEGVVLDKVAQYMRKILADSRQRAADRASALAASVAAIAACPEDVEEESGVAANENSTSVARDGHLSCRELEVALWTKADEACDAMRRFWDGLVMPPCAPPSDPPSFQDTVACMEARETWTRHAQEQMRVYSDACHGNLTAAGEQRQRCSAAQAAFEAYFCRLRSSTFAACDAATRCYEKRTAAHAALVEEATRNESVDKLRFEAAKNTLCELSVLDETANLTMMQELRDACLDLVPDTSVLDVALPEVPPATSCDTTAVESKPCDGDWVQREYNQSWAERAAPSECIPCSRRLTATALQVPPSPVPEALDSDPKIFV